MTSDRIEQIQKETAYPNSVSVMIALNKVWNELQQECNKQLECLKEQIESKDNQIRLQDAAYSDIGSKYSKMFIQLSENTDTINTLNWTLAAKNDEINQLKNTIQYYINEQS